MSAQSAITWLCIAAFAITIVITMLALVGKVRLGGGTATRHHQYLNKLFYALIIEIAGICIANFRSVMNADPANQISARAPSSASIPSPTSTRILDHSLAPTAISSKSESSPASKTKGPFDVPSPIPRRTIYGAFYASPVGTASIHVVFRNLSQRNIYIGWIDHDGKLDPGSSFPLVSGASRGVSTYVGHVWIISDLDSGEDIIYELMTESTKEVNFSGQ